MTQHSGQFERVKGLFSSAYEAGQAVGARINTTPRGNCRVHVEGDKGRNFAGSIRMHSDFRGGTVFNHRTRMCASWRDDAGRKLTYEERRQANIDWAVQKAKKAEKERQDAIEGAYTASLIFKSCRPCTDHPYLRKKHITPTSTMYEIDARSVEIIMRDRGIRADVGSLYHCCMKGKLLVIPIMKKGALCSLQFITAEGKKQFMKTGSVGSAYWLSRPLEAYRLHDVIGIAEGVATARSIEMVEGIPCVASLSSGNLKNTAIAIRELFPDSNILILSDVGNGEGDAVNAGKSIGAPVAKPFFTDEIIRDFKIVTGSKDNPTDWNDYCIATGRI